ncbi:MAG TPA: hypothetical protein VF175_05225 [Lacipirellula sp.]
MQLTKPLPITSTQQWLRKDRIHVPSTDHRWIRSHAQVPTPYAASPETLRIYFGARDANNRTSTVFVDVDANNPAKVLRLHDEPVLPLGSLGCFDDAGVMPSCVVTVGNQLYLYYTGWNTSTTVPYRNSIGVAVSDDGGFTFRRPFEGPILDRTAAEPHFCATPFVMRDGGLWRMWYLSCTEWTMVDGKPEARYLIRYAESNDRLEWRRPRTIAIDYLRPDEAIARPWVLKGPGGYEMWYCFRSNRGYRADVKQSYRLGYATSADGLAWTRQDDVPQLTGPSDGWDADMLAYPAVVEAAGRRYLFYNGNGFGRTGFGLAELST